MSGDSDVDTTGSLAYAFNINASAASPTVNGVTFAPCAFPANFSTNTVTVGTVRISESKGTLVSYPTLVTATAPYSGLSSSYQTLLIDGGSANVALVMTVTLDANTTDTVGGLGQHVIGTFTPSGTSVPLNLSATPGNVPLVSRLQVRLVPEPAILPFTIAGMVAAGLVVRRRLAASGRHARAGRTPPSAA